MDFRPILFIVGVFVCMTGGLMLFPMLADLLVGSDNWQAFGASSLIAGAIGTGLIASCWGKIEGLTTKQSFMMVTAIWASIATIGALPFILGTKDLTLTDAFFESMSGLTTTG
ncbi:MAG: potassium transporter TrkH, partial [Pseudomonadota bacterium]